MTKISQQDLDTLFYQARTHYNWSQEPVSDSLLEEIYDAAKMAPTSANCSPLRVVFVKSLEAKEKLKPCLAPGNVDKTMAAPVTAIFAYDLEFYQHMPFLFPFTDAKSWWEGKPAFIEESAKRNETLQAAYFMMAARALGLDCGPMSGFDNAAVDEAFFKGTSFKSDFLCNLGMGDSTQLPGPRAPRFEFKDTCKII
ncbi:Putative malonic semialdehyde reductase RutE [Candidatus Bealeia paramacronuclearis]|uniref:Putative NADH dehydrogenase/NAD(P)H nitroreductase Bealeia1_00770 n=1 Tax=Candidatus Bealeia paramacronuclearis TaxID=1921001 RepID=A0ABZ2C286_9PROT|nr:putative malonic semialdehyde reductase RutE [Candidatus Bealeia paramacronuclearis]